MMHSVRISSKNSAFTLVEIATVLVVIGLLVGGVFAGKELIKSAQVRATVAQIESFKAAANAFKLKYNCLPGDCPNPAEFGFGGGCSALGDTCGNGTVGGAISVGLASFEESGRESYDFWLQLSQSLLIEGNFSGFDAAFPADLTVESALPSIKLSSKVGLLPRALGSVTGAPNYFWTYVSYSISPTVTHPLDQLLPMDNFLLDSKMDDGFPDSGNVLLGNISGYYLGQNYGLARDAAYAYGPAGATSNFCATDDTPALYNVLNVTPYWDYIGHDVTTNCSIGIKAGF